MRIVYLLPWILGFCWALYGYLGSKGIIKNMPGAAAVDDEAQRKRAGRLYPIMMAACLFFLIMEIFNLYASIKAK